MNHIEPDLHLSLNRFFIRLGAMTDAVYMTKVRMISRLLL